MSKTTILGNSLDPDFDFGKAYRRHYSMLIMVWIAEADMEISYQLDGKEKIFKDPEVKFMVLCREFNPVKNSIAFLPLRNNEFFTTKEGAENLIEKLVAAGEIEKLDDAGIEETFLRQLNPSS